MEHDLERQKSATRPCLINFATDITAYLFLRTILPDFYIRDRDEQQVQAADSVVGR